jgi:hypothetical protein
MWPLLVSHRSFIRSPYLSLLASQILVIIILLIMMMVWLWSLIEPLHQTIEGGKSSSPVPDSTLPTAIATPIGGGTTTPSPRSMEETKINFLASHPGDLHLHTLITFVSTTFPLMNE